MTKTISKSMLAWLVAAFAALALLPQLAFAAEGEDAAATAFTVYEAASPEAEPVAVKAYTADEFAALTANKETRVGTVTVAKGNSNQVLAASNYVTIKELVTNAGLAALADDDYIKFYISDAEKGKVVYSGKSGFSGVSGVEVNSDLKLFGGYSIATPNSTDDPIAAPAVIATKYAKGTVTEDVETNTARKVFDSLQGKETEGYRFFMGQTEANYVAKGLQNGDSTPEKLIGIAVFRAAKAAETPAPSAASPELSVKKKSITLPVKAKKGKLAKKQTVKAAKVTKGNSAKTKISYSLVKVDKKKAAKFFKVASSGKITVAKKLPAGTYKLTVKATAKAGNGYAKDAKNFTVTVKLKK